MVLQKITLWNSFRGCLGIAIYWKLEKARILKKPREKPGLFNLARAQLGFFKIWAFLTTLFDSVTLTIPSNRNPVSELSLLIPLFFFSL